jgi:hypothetical protein
VAAASAADAAGVKSSTRVRSIASSLLTTELLGGQACLCGLACHGLFGAWSSFQAASNAARC